MWAGDSSLQARLFFQSFKAFKEGKPSEAARYVPMLNLQIKEMDIFLRHDDKKLLLDYLLFLKQKSQELSPEKWRFARLEEFIYAVQLALYPKKESYGELMARGKKLLEEKNGGEALVLFKQALKLQQTEEALVLKASIELQQKEDLKNFNNTIEKAMALNADPLALPVYEYLIRQMQSKNHVSLQLKFKIIRRAISLKSKDPNIFLELALVGYESHQKLQQYKDVLQSCPESIEKPFALGMIELSESNHHSASQLFLACEQKIHQNEKNRLLAERRLRQNGDDSLFRKVSNFKRADELCFYLGKTAQELPTRNEMEFFEKGLKYNQNNLKIWNELIKWHRKNPGREGEIWFLIETAPNELMYEFGIIEAMLDMLYQSGEKVVLIEATHSLTSTLPNSDQLFYLIANVHYKYNDYAQCKKYCQLCLEVSAKNEGAYFLLGRIAFDEKRISEAREYYRKAIQLNPEQYLAYFNLGVLEYRECKYEEAVKSLQRATKRNSEFSPAYQLLIYAFMKQGKFEQAMERAMNLPQRENESFLLDFFYARISFQEEKDEEAEKYFRLVLEKQKKHEESMYLLAVICITQANLQQQGEAELTEAEGYISQLCSQPAPKAHYKAAQHYLLLRKNKQQAVLEFQKTINSGKASFQAYFHLGCALTSTQLSQTLSQQIQGLIASSDSNPESYYHLGLFNLGYRNYDAFLEEFNKYLNHCKGKGDESRQVSKVYRKIISDLQHLLRFYPHNKDLMLLLGILNRDVNNRQKSLRYFHRLQGSTNLFNNFLSFYHTNSQYHQHLSYIQFIFEFIFQEVFENDQMEGMQLYHFLRDAQAGFNDNEAILFVIRERKRDLCLMDFRRGDEKLEKEGLEWRERIIEDGCFRQGREMIAAIRQSQQKEKYLHCTMYQVYCNKLFPFIYHDIQAIRSLELALQPFLTSGNLIESILSSVQGKVTSILFPNSQLNSNPYSQRYQSQIFFSEFNLEEVSPLVSLSPSQAFPFRLLPPPPPGPSKRLFKYPNSLQKKLVKHKQRAVSQILLRSPSSFISKPKVNTTIIIEQWDDPF